MWMKPYAGRAANVSLAGMNWDRREKKIEYSGCRDVSAVTANTKLTANDNFAPKAVALAA